jgi:hypothetical protein
MLRQLFSFESLETRELADYDTYTPAVFSKPWLQALMKVEPADGAGGEFKLMLTGKEHLDVAMRMSEILPLEAFADMTVIGRFQLGAQVQLQPNSSASRWMDMLELIQSQDLEVIDKNNVVVTEDFLKMFENWRKKEAENTSLGISWRWMVVVKLDSKQLELQVKT